MGLCLCKGFINKKISLKQKVRLLYRLVPIHNMQLRLTLLNVYISKMETLKRPLNY